MYYKQKDAKRLRVAYLMSGRVSSSIDDTQNIHILSTPKVLNHQKTGQLG